MARSHGRVLASIWRDEDFLAHEPSAQRLYMLLLSQPDLEHSGLIGLRLARWAQLGKGTSPATIRADLVALQDQGRFVVVDWDTEEVLVRTLIKNDGIWKSPRLMEIVARDFCNIM